MYIIIRRFDPHRMHLKSMIFEIAVLDLKERISIWKQQKKKPTNI